MAADQVGDPEPFVVEGVHQLPHGLDPPRQLPAVLREALRPEVAGVEGRRRFATGPFPAPERQEDAGGIHRVEEGEGVPGEHQSARGAVTRPVGVVAGGAHRGGLRRRFQVVPDPGIHFDLAAEDRLRIAALAVQVVGFRGHPDADLVVGQRDVPEPSPSGEQGDGGRSLVVAARIPPAAAVVTPERDLAQSRIHHPPAEEARGEGVAPGAVHRDRRGNDLLAVFGLDADARDRASVRDSDRGRRIRFLPDEAAGQAADHLGAPFDSVLQQEAVELVAPHLPGLRGLVVELVEEVERARDLALDADELDAVLLHERRSADFLQGAGPFEREVAVGHQGFPHRVAGESALLDDRRPLAGPREDRGGGGAGRAAADDDRIRFAAAHRPGGPRLRCTGYRGARGGRRAAAAGLCAGNRLR